MRLDSVGVDCVGGRVPLKKQNGGLNGCGVVWVILSAIATVIACASALSSSWLIGELVDPQNGGTPVPASFGLYKRCGYPVFDKVRQQLAVSNECARYQSLSALPSLEWQLCVILAAIGVSLCVICTLLLAPSICIDHVVTAHSAPLLGFAQIVAGIALSASVVIYPLGWSSVQVRQVCGGEAVADKYALGTCQLSWGLYALASAALLIVVCGLMSLHSARSSAAYALQLDHHPIALYDDSTSGCESDRRLSSTTTTSSWNGAAPAATTDTARLGARGSGRMLLNASYYHRIDTNLV